MDVATLSCDARVPVRGDQSGGRGLRDVVGVWGAGKGEGQREPEEGGKGEWGTVGWFRGLFPGVVIRRRGGMKKADFQGISMISGNTKSIPVLGGGRV